VRHGGVRGGPVPMLDTGRDGHDVAGVHLQFGTVPLLDPSGTGGDDQRLDCGMVCQWVRAPGAKVI
jgi:hypothetical protein